MKFKCLHGETMFSHDGRKFIATGGFFTTDEKGLCDFLKSNRNYVVVEDKAPEVTTEVTTEEPAAPETTDAAPTRQRAQHRQGSE